MMSYKFSVSSPNPRLYIPQLHFHLQLISNRRTYSDISFCEFSVNCQQSLVFRILPQYPLVTTSLISLTCISSACQNGAYSNGVSIVIGPLPNIGIARTKDLLKPSYSVLSPCLNALGNCVGRQCSVKFQ